MFSFFRKGNERIFGRMGYNSDQEGIMRRYRREAANWQSHMQHTKDFILQSAAKKSKGSVAVLGSGWLLDVPIRELSEMFEKVYLFDIYHPKNVRRELKTYHNIVFIETDISGFALPIYRLVKQRPVNFEEQLQNMQPIFDFDCSKFDYIVSCNILNQLDILLIDFVKRYENINSEVELQLRKTIQKKHLELLPKFKSCFVSDVEEIWLNKNNEEFSRKNLQFVEFSNFDCQNEWFWHFDNYFTYSSTHKTWFKVIAGSI